MFLALVYVHPSKVYKRLPFLIYFSAILQLMDLQLSDSNFRRHILVQYLILFQYLKGQVKFKR